jgi:hypothetical protein
MDRAQPNAPLGAARRLVQVYDGGAIPTAPDHIFLTHPAEIDGVETEGGTATFAVDTTTTIPVDVLWHPAVAGDYLVAYAVGGRWVSEIMGAPPPGNPCCGTCTNTPRVLSLTETNLTFFSGPVTLTYAGGAVWTGSNTYPYPGAALIGCPAATVPISWSFGALEDNNCLLAASWPIYLPDGASENCPTTALLGTGTASTIYTLFGSPTCSPFDIQFSVSAVTTDPYFILTRSTSGIAELTGSGETVSC